MTDETVDCFNCGRANPEWAQVCRSCGVALRHGEARVVPAGRFPTDRNSLISLAAVIGTIVAALLLGLFVSGLNPTNPPVAVESSASARASASPIVTATPTEEPSVAATESAVASVSVAPSASEAPALPGTIVFGSELDGDRQIIEPVDTFTPGMTFAHSITSTEPFGAATIGEQVVRLNDDGTEGDQLVAADGNQLTVNPEATSAGFVAGDSANFVRDWGAGAYELRVYVGETLIARAPFRLAEG